jgi:hypothetical protein
MRWVIACIILCILSGYVSSMRNLIEVGSKQEDISRLIRESLIAYGYDPASEAHRVAHLVKLPEDKSEIHSMCDRLQFNHEHDYDLYRFSCCAPAEVRHLYNVMIADKKIIYYNKDKIQPNHHLSVPKIKSMRLQQAYYFSMEIEESEQAFQRSRCKSYFNGTLHVIGRGTVKNVYHSIADNFIPVVTQIMEDYILDPEFLFLPRMQLMGFQPNDPSAVPHIRMIDKLMSGGSITTDEVTDILVSHPIACDLHCSITSLFSRRMECAFAGFPGVMAPRSCTLM